jgi:PAS domain S-box-containing protein
MGAGAWTRLSRAVVPSGVRSDGKGELDHVIAAFEIMRQSLERAYDDLRESEQRFRDYAETASDWFWATGPQHDFTYFSEQVGAFGIDWGKLIGKRRWEVATDFSPEAENWREHMAILERRQPFRDFVYEIRRVDGSVGFASISGKPVFDAESGFSGYRGVARDITARKRAEEALEKAQAELAHVTRVATLGELAASIAHEVNQPLAAIVADATASLNRLATSPPDLGSVREALDAIVKDGHRAADVILRIRQLARKTDPQKARLDVNDVVRDVVLLIGSEVRSHEVSLRIDLAPALPPVLADRIQLQQVLINFVINGIEAMASVDDRSRELVIRSQPQGRDHVVVAVQDAGVGIDAQKTDQLFSTFYTTKPDGMGMGLSISRSIIEAHGGRLWATPNPDHGATFHFALPKVQ